ncbi:MAG: hypothetical protein RLZZ136_1028 [Pseudomonadota bacterium]
MLVNQTTLVMLGLLLAAWAVLAAWAILAARARVRRAEAAQGTARRMARMLDGAPALPLLVRTDGRIEAAPRLAGWLGLDAVPQFLSELSQDNKGFPADQLTALHGAVLRTQKTGAPFRMVATPLGSKRSLVLRGHLSDPQVSPGGAALVWIFDFSDSEGELVDLREEAARAREDFSALVGLIEAAPIPMWFRAPEGQLRLVNQAYVTAVAGESAEAVVEASTELIERIDGLSARQVARQAFDRKRPIERMVAATIAGQRRMLRVSDLPLGPEGVAGYAIDVEDMEELARTLRAFRSAQRSMLDQLSAGVAQFDAKHNLVFANQPFHRIFALKPIVALEPPSFERLLDMARDAARLPEARDFPAWRRERAAWFLSGETQDEDWPLPDGTHLRVVAHPMPDGSLLMIVEDRTEHLQMSSARDILLRTRTVIFDSLYEAVAVFAPDGRLQQWNRRFAADWRLDSEFLDTHPKIDDLLERVAPQLAYSVEVKGVGEVVRAATLDRKQSCGRLALANGITQEFTGIPLPDGNSLLTVIAVGDSPKTAVVLQQNNAGQLEVDTGKSHVSEGGSTALGNGQAIGLFDFMVGLAQERAEQLTAKGLALDLRGDQRVGSVQGDRTRLSEALGQIIDNAIAGTGRGGRILIALSRVKSGNARIMISDNGQGLDTADLTHADGMKLARQAVEDHGGAIERLAEPDVGTAVVITLP